MKILNSCPRLLRLFICGYAIAVIVQATAGAEDPKSADPTTQQIIDRMIKAYAECKSYQDSGVVVTQFALPTGNRTDEKPFTTSFVRPDHFRFEFKDKARAYIVWSKGKDVKTWWDVQPEVKTPDSLMLAIAGATGVSGGSAFRIPSMLMPSMFTGAGGKQFGETRRIEDGILEKVPYYCIETNQANRSGILWIDKKTYVLKRIDEKIETTKVRFETTTTYNPVINEKIPDKSMAFNPPAK